MSEKYDDNVGKHPKILRREFGRNYDVKKSAYTLDALEQTGKAKSMKHWIDPFALPSEKQKA